MDTTRFDAVTRRFGEGMSRRAALRGLVAGAAAIATGGSLLAVEDAAARKKKRRKKRRSPRPNPCAAKNWCEERSHLCGPVGGYGKCLIEIGSGNICGELLFQAATCAACEPADCANCRCVSAVGGDDKCNNGTNGYDFVCVRAV